MRSRFPGVGDATFSFRYPSLDSIHATAPLYRTSDRNLCPVPDYRARRQRVRGTKRRGDVANSVRHERPSRENASRLTRERGSTKAVQFLDVCLLPGDDFLRADNFTKSCGSGW